MKKILIAVVALGLFAFIATAAHAQEEYVAGGFEASGHVMAGMGYQHHNNKAPTEFEIDSDGIGTTSGPMGKYLGTLPATNSDHFSFFVDSVELDLMKSFGENIRLRADLSFGRIASSGIGTAGLIMEQAYATANIPLGNGIEFLLGRFDTPIGFESNDAAENYTISRSSLVRSLRPGVTTGAKIYYAFSDLVDLHFYVVNSLTQDSDVKVGEVPSLGFRLGFNWGDEGSESTFGVSGLFGPESRVSNKHFTFAGDLDLNWWITESFALGFEGLYRRDNQRAGGFVAAGTNVTYYSGLLNLHYLFSDVWDGTLKYCYVKQNNPGAISIAPATQLTGRQQDIHEIALAGGYAIADGAKLKLEGRFDIVQPKGAATTGTQYVFGGAMAFVYNF
jgi:Putative beta-barrel porin-2, OmpL-like. bbp2